MTLRPFKLEHMKVSGIVFKNRKNGTHHVLDHRGQTVGMGVVANKRFWNKLLSYPVTAFGYNIPSEYDELPNPKFDKFQVIKALDFWIEYFVYQNKCDYILEGTVSTEFELHLEELIRVREAVMKESIDTKYVRQKIRPITEITAIDPNGKDTGISIFKKQIIEFTENVLDASNTPFSTVDQFCYKVRTMTRKEYEQQNNGIFILGKRSLTSQQINDLTDALALTGHLFVGAGTVPEDIQRAASFADDENGWSFGDLRSGGRHSDATVRERHPLNPNNWEIVPNMIGTIQEGFKIINIINGLNIATDFRTEGDARLYIHEIRRRG